MLLADLANNTDNTLSGDLVVVCSGLDGRLVERPLDKFLLTAGAHRQVQIPIGGLPIQSEESTAFVTVHAKIARANGTVVGVPAAPVYYHFQNGYQEAVLHSGEEVATTLKGGVLQPDLRRVVGRVRELDGSFTDVVAGSALPTSAIDPTHPRLGLTRAIATPATSIGTGSGAARGVGIPAPAAAIRAATTPEETKDANGAAVPCCVNVTVQLCSTWRVQFIDSGLGEDVLATSSWQDAPAKFAHAIVWASDNSMTWQGQLDLDGCTTLTLPPDDYTLEQWTTGVWNAGVGFDIYYMSNGTPYVYSLYSSFSPGSNVRR